MNDDPKKPVGETQDGSAGDASPVDSASPQHAGHGPSRLEDAADLPDDEGLRALYAQLPDVEPRAELDEAILAASREVLRGVASNRHRPARRTAKERATRVLRWSLPVAAAASVIFAVLRERGDFVPQAEFAASPSPREVQGSRPNQEHAGRISEPSSAPAAPAEQTERDDSASPRFAPPSPPPAVESKRKAAPVSPMADAVRKAAPASPEARSAAREAFDSSAAIGALAAKEPAPGFSITENDKPWPLGLEFAMSTETACAKLRALSSRGCVLRDGVAVVELDEAWRMTSGVHEGRWIVAVKMIAKNGRITKLDLTERQEEKE